MPIRFDFWRKNKRNFAWLFRGQLIRIASELLVFLCYSASRKLCLTLWALDFGVVG
jgi:hypothetical protein